jgi:hypothetical protein
MLNLDIHDAKRSNVALLITEAEEALATDFKDQ